MLVQAYLFLTHSILTVYNVKYYILGIIVVYIG